jgi:hypothetical protein
MKYKNFEKMQGLAALFVKTHFYKLTGDFKTIFWYHVSNGAS